MADQAIYAPMVVLDANGLPVAGARASFYATGANTLIPVYADQAGTILATNPVVADGAGYLPQRYFNGDAKVVIRTADGETIRTLDPVPKSLASISGAGQVTFAPTGNVPQLTVQDAIVAVDTNARSREAAISAALGDLAPLDTITTAQIAPTTLVTSGEGILSNDNDTTIPTSAAVADLAFGVGQSWTDVAGSRVGGTTYQNTGNRTIFVSLRAEEPSGPRTVQTSIDGIAWVTIGTFQASAESYSFPVPPSHRYRINGSCTISIWSELA